MAIIKTIYWDQKDPDEIIYKYPSHEITLGSILTVNESQEACFFKNGMLYDRFTAGRYTLSSANLPLLNKVVDLVSGGDTTFLAEIWFVAKTERRDLFWGTGGLRIIDPYFEIPLKLYGRGGIWRKYYQWRFVLEKVCWYTPQYYNRFYRRAVQSKCG